MVGLPPIRHRFRSDAARSGNGPFSRFPHGRPSGAGRRPRFGRGEAPRRAANRRGEARLAGKARGAARRVVECGGGGGGGDGTGERRSTTRTSGRLSSQSDVEHAGGRSSNSPSPIPIDALSPGAQTAFRPHCKSCFRFKTECFFTSRGKSIENRKQSVCDCGFNVCLLKSAAGQCCRAREPSKKNKIKKLERER